MNEENDLGLSSLPVPRFGVTDFLATCNQTLDYAFSNVEVEGEISNYKVSKGKWVFFDLKDKTATVNCFTTIFQMRTTIRDGMHVVVSGTPRITAAGRFSLTITNIQPLGEGNIKKAFELLKKKLERQGIFDPSKKRPVPAELNNLAVISSVTAAGYIDFIKILNERWGGIDITVANCGVQGLSAADEIIRAIDFFNAKGSYDIIAIIRGGGSPDDLAVFNDEFLAKKIASSRIPIITGIGHEIDESLADLAADVRASTPSNAAELLTKDKNAEIWRVYDNFSSLEKYLVHFLDTLKETNQKNIENAEREISHQIENSKEKISQNLSLLESLNPEKILKQGYAILSGSLSVGNVVKITTKDYLAEAKINRLDKREKS
ncbi:exodeoxyribonuclease VII large subunit [Candidatus Saccharibacteria bacterium]|nr:exodeoxyribonuclease VII large subunit [Candidatus Saccharibacteria bacterium]